MAILGALFKKSCNRKIKRPKSKMWFPLIGSTECDNIEDAIKGTPFADVGNLYEGSSSGGGGLLDKIKETGSYIDKMFQNINPYLMETKTSLNGAKIINDATPGKEKQITSGPGGVTSFQDSHGNEHVNVPNNQTKIIAKDKCETIKGNYCLTVEGDFYLKVMGNYHEEITGAKNEHNSQGPQSESGGDSKSPDTSGEGGATAATDTNVTSGQIPAETQKQSNNAATANDLGSGGNFLNYRSSVTMERDRVLKEQNVGGFYPVDEIPYHPDSDEWGRTPQGPQLSAALQDDNEQKSSLRLEGDHEIAYTGEIKIQGSKVKITAVEGINLNSQTIKLEANTIENVADGEITNEANWITSFLNAGRFEFVALFNPFAALTGQFSLVKGSIVDVVTDLPFPSVSPPTHTRVAFSTTIPGSMNDIIGGAVSGVHNTFIAAPTGVITEFVTAGNIMNQVVTGMASYSVGAGYMATGCGFGPHQVYGLPLLLN